MKTVITITHDPEKESIKLDVKGAKGYVEILGIIEHAKMQLMCTYNKDVFEPNEDDESLFQ